MTAEQVRPRKSGVGRTPAAVLTWNEEQRERIAARAYERYLARGAEDGQAMEDWLAAEAELAAALMRAKPRRARASQA